MGFVYSPCLWFFFVTDGIGTEYGVVTKCDHKERTVMVKWMKPYQGQSGR